RLAGFVAVSMARPSHLEGRLLAVLDEARRRHSISPRGRWVTAATLALVMVPLAGLRPEPSTASTRHRGWTVTSSQTRSETAAGTLVERSIPATPGETLRLDLDTGGTVELHGWDEQRVSVRAQLGGRDWRDTRVVVERMNDGVRVRSTQEGERVSYSTSHSF